MDPSCLEHVLTDTEREFFESQGYLPLPGVLDETLRLRLVEAVDRIDARERPRGAADRLLSVTNVVHEDDAFVELLDWSRVLPKVWGILGWNIYLYHSHVDVTPPATVESRGWSVAWHQDSMRVNDELETSPRPRLSIKVGYYLTDVSEPNRGNTLVVPGSQVQDEIDCPQDGQSSPAGSTPLCVPAGSAVIIDRRIWHSRSPNLHGPTRKVVWLGYAYRWLRPKDEMTVEQLYPRLDPIRRQLLGDGLSANGAYDPVDGDVPLRGWLREHWPAAAEWSVRGRAASRPPAMVRGANSGRQ